MEHDLFGNGAEIQRGHCAHNQAIKAAKETGFLMPSKHILNAPTGLMKELGCGFKREYDHEAKVGFSAQDYFPEGMPQTTFNSL